MKTATVRDLRNNFARLSKWLEKGETIEIVKRGKPVADLVPKSGGKRKTLLGCTPSPAANLRMLSSEGLRSPRSTSAR